jgi:hypothetical protein
LKTHMASMSTRNVAPVINAPADANCTMSSVPSKNPEGKAAEKRAARGEMAGRGSYLSGLFEGKAAENNKHSKTVLSRATHNANAMSFEEHPGVRGTKLLFQFNGFELRVSDACGPNLVHEVAFVISLTVTEEEVRNGVRKTSARGRAGRITCTRCRQ